MNLADIRKKAQQDTPADGSPGVRHNGGAAAGGVGADTGISSHEAEEERLQRLPAAVVTCLPTQEFDPLSVLLAGRLSAGCDEAWPAEDLPEQKVVNDFEEFLCLRVSSEIYGIDIMEIKEIVKPREITEVPRGPSFISGVLSLRGIIIPVFDMHSRLGLAEEGGAGKERIVVVKKGEEFCGLLVDEVIQVVRIAAGTIEQPPAVLEGIDRDFVNGIGRFDNRMMILLNMKSILDISLC